MFKVMTIKRQLKHRPIYYDILSLTTNNKTIHVHYLVTHRSSSNSKRGKGVSCNIQLGSVEALLEAAATEQDIELVRDSLKSWPATDVASLPTARSRA